LRYFLDITYLGTNYHGWQIQANAHSVQAEIQAKLSLLLGNSIEVVGSGRTDTGVHAKQQIAHFNTSQSLDIQDFIYKMNKILPIDISIQNMYVVADTAHARFDAVRRSYEYYLSPHKNPFLINLAYFDGRDFDFDLMNEAAQILLQHTDFQCFSRVKTEVNNFNCTINQAHWYFKNEVWVFEISANRFLRGMVRAIVGTLLEVGLRKLQVADFEAIILSQDRRRAGRAVPPEGLYLTKVEYPESLPKMNRQG
jgi:tRNA pseudouridine38-40 synthase